MEFMVMEMTFFLILVFLGGGGEYLQSKQGFANLFKLTLKVRPILIFDVCSFNSFSEIVKN